MATPYPSATDELVAALLIPDSAAKVLHILRRKVQGPDGPSPPFHLTLARFTAPPGPYRATLQDFCRETPPPAVLFSGLNATGASLLIRPEPGLQRLYSRLYRRLKAIGAIHRYPYMEPWEPHVTIAYGPARSPLPDEGAIQPLLRPCRLERLVVWKYGDWDGVPALEQHLTGQPWSFAGNSPDGPRANERTWPSLPAYVPLIHGSAGRGDEATIPI